MMRSKIAQFVSVIFKFMFCIGIISLFFVPTLYDTFSGSQEIAFDEQTFYHKSAFYLCAIGSLAIVYQFISIFNDVYKGSPFKKATVIRLKTIAVLFMILSSIIVIKILFIPTILSTLISLATFIASLSFYVLSQVFKVAITYKDEIDCTI